MSNRDLLIEIGTEELPPKALRLLSNSFTDGIRAGLAREGLGFESIDGFATPRRLAVIVKALVEVQPDKQLERFGPAVDAAYDKAGNPTQAALGFARSCNVDVRALEIAEKDGTRKLRFRSIEHGRKTVSLLESVIAGALAALPIPKRMRWGSSRVEFVRPVHWFTLLYGREIVDATVLGKKSGNVTYGHRFHHPGSIELGDVGDYAKLLQGIGYVIPAFAARREKIRELVLQEAGKLGASVRIEDDLLDEVTSLVEWPVALTGRFDEHFLRVPQEAIVSSLTAHQKCFHLTDNSGHLLPNFIAISNLASRDPGQVIEGNERVIRPRLSDADFFYQTDRKQRLESRMERLKSIVFQQKLGTLHDKSVRVAALARWMAGETGADADLCERAAQLSKCDLVSRMVGEFADLQGIMGRYYAQHDEEPAEVAEALYEQYLPRYAGDGIPATVTGSILALADRLDTIAGLFAIGQPPTGSKDPFALRRTAIGILRILVERRIDLDLRQAIEVALGGFSGLVVPAETGQLVFAFLLERFRSWYLDEGISAEVFQSVMVLSPSRPVDFAARVLAVDHFSKLEEAKALAGANKRVANILAKLDADPLPDSVNREILTEPAEIALADALARKELEVAPLFDAREYQAGLEKLAGLKQSVDDFFDHVLVMAEDRALRDNRLALLTRVRNLFLRVADISYLHQP